MVITTLHPSLSIQDTEHGFNFGNGNDNWDEGAARECLKGKFGVDGRGEVWIRVAGAERGTVERLTCSETEQNLARTNGKEAAGREIEFLFHTKEIEIRNTYTAPPKYHLLEKEIPCFDNN